MKGIISAGASLVGVLSGLGGVRTVASDGKTVTQESRDYKREARDAAKAEKARLQKLFAPPVYRPNTLRGNLGWSGVAWVFPQTREAARRRRQMEAATLKRQRLHDAVEAGLRSFGLDLDEEFA